MVDSSAILELARWAMWLFTVGAVAILGVYVFVFRAVGRTYKRAEDAELYSKRFAQSEDVRLRAALIERDEQIHTPLGDRMQRIEDKAGHAAVAATIAARETRMVVMFMRKQNGGEPLGDLPPLPEPPVTGG